MHSGAHAISAAPLRSFHTVVARFTSPGSRVHFDRRGDAGSVAWYWNCGERIPLPDETHITGDRMRKLHLDPDHLAVDSFRVTEAEDERQGAMQLITQGAQTCYDCTRFGCPGTQLC